MTHKKTLPLIWLFSGLFSGLMFINSLTWGQNYPVKTVKIIVPLAAGGPGDVLARTLAQKLSDLWKQTVIVDNRPGANTNLGTELVAKAPPDGYTLLATANTLTINPSLYHHLNYNPVSDFSPITLIGATPLILVIHPSLPVKTPQALVTLAKAHPGQLLFGSAGNGSGPHLAGEMFTSMANIKMIHVPYKGITNAFSDLLGGQISLMFPGPPIALPQVQVGKLRALATTSMQRTAAAPELPTLNESGLPGYDVTSWYGVFAPATTPNFIINKLNSQIGQILLLADIQQRWASLGAEPLQNTPEAFIQFIKTDLIKWAKVVRETNIKIE